mmetsp:Transcript_109337/g.189756  ORF Transcript_109337/g.189756 Transcript_109337/m.189756 type:complete len:150 (-) Transcript_109337:193-642(-)
MGAGQSPAEAMCVCCTKRDFSEYQEGRPRYALPSATASPYSSGDFPAAPLGLSTGPCIICREASANTICLPCGHLLVCFRCSLRYVVNDGSGLIPDVRCPACKQSVQSFQRVFTQSPAALARFSEAGHGGDGGRPMARMGNSYSSMYSR